MALEAIAFLGQRLGGLFVHSRVHRCRAQSGKQHQQTTHSSEFTHYFSPQRGEL
jgi:hypothetical protein